MSELKSVYIDRAGDWCRSGNDTGKFYLKSEAEKVIRHAKYKRCMAMAKMCAWEQRFWGDGIPAYERQFQWENRAAKWKKRWLEIAEQFKPNNQTAQ